MRFLNTYKHHCKLRGHENDNTFDRIINREQHPQTDGGFLCLNKLSGYKE